MPNTSALMLRTYMYLPCTRALGPHLRFALWVQGCSFNCPGCMTPAARPLLGGKELSLDYLAARIIAEPGIEGLTISGGEPFLQAQALSVLLAAVKKERDLGVVIYSGYRLAELRCRAGVDAFTGRLLGMTDLLIDGPYVESLNDGLSLRGSGNQGLYLLSDRYAALAGQYYCRPHRAVELHLLNDRVIMAGIPGPQILRKWQGWFLPSR